ncbi:MAG: double-strand break repair helicase AddA [Alphaproteobacteria bacterium]
MPQDTLLKTIGSFSPEASVFVAANAGSGKTSKLTKRVLGLLLHGIAPSRILCLTFTNAAAAEMSERVQRQLGNWVMMDEKLLIEHLQELLGYPPETRQINFARSLFASVLDSPEGVRIQTIHGFSQSLLRRFPLEAGVSPHFAVMDTRTEDELLHEAKIRLFSHTADADSKVKDAIYALARTTSESALKDILQDAIKNKQKFQRIFSEPAGLENACYDIYRTLGVSEHHTEQQLVDSCFDYDDLTLHKLRKAISVMQHSGKTDKQRADKFARWFAAKEKNIERADEYRLAFLRANTLDPLESIFTKNCFAGENTLADAMLSEQARVLAFDQQLRSLRIAKRSSYLLTIAHALLSQYESLKQSHALMDYDDLILTANNLLNRSGVAAWVLYKLDGGIDHILVDEAQDTSPLQWNIIKALTEDFFAGQGKREVPRSLFVVGDEKQSIYRFQGANVEALQTMQEYFTRKIEDSGGIAIREKLNTSFRSLTNVLNAVDTVFSTNLAKNGVMFNDEILKHNAYRKTHTGYVELWPLYRKDDEEQYTAKSQLVKHIADTIGGWLSEGMMLESKNRRINAGDIMILVRTRTDFVDKLSRALKRRNIPVAGIDRMKLGDNLAVQDLLALGQFLLLPDDNLTLACVLKSPIGNITEEILFELSYNRGDTSLWDRLAHHPQCADVYALLKNLRAKTDYLKPYELYTYTLDTLGIRRQFTGRMGMEYGEAIDEFLSQALLYEQSHIPTMQGFLHWLASSEGEIQRDMEAAKGTVRIMTIHAAKGLQAPVVILPDTCGKSGVKEKILWDNEQLLPLWSESTRAANHYYKTLREKELGALNAEYRRQLYVAMTRAEDLLYIGGHTERGEEAAADSWYGLIANGLAGVAEHYENDQGQGFRLGTPPAYSHGAPPHGRPSSIVDDASDLHYLRHPIHADPEPSKPLTPSRLPDDAPPATSPLRQKAFFSRGECIHLLLQHLPHTQESQHADVIEHVSARYRHAMQAKELEQCIHEALAVITNPKFIFIFSKDSMAEVPITGVVHIKGQPYTVSGQIDRLYVGDDVWVVDYKTGQIPPDNANIPKHYLRQMTLYKLLLSKIYPQKAIQCALLWTSAPQISIIPEALLDETAFSSYI